MEMISLQIEIFLLIVVGYLLAKFGYFDKNTRTQLTNIILTVILPCSIVKSFQMEMTKELLMNTLMILIISFGIQGLYALTNRVLYQKLPADRKACCQYGTMVSNAGFMGMPIAESVFGSTGLLYASIFLIPQRIFMWSSGLSLFAKTESGSVFKKVATNPCIIAIYIGIIVMIAKMYGVNLPAPVTQTLAAISSCNTALSMFVIGGILTEVSGDEILDKEVFFYSFVRLIALPLIILFITRLLRLDVLPANVCVLLSAMPAASATAMLAQKYNANAKYASKLVFVSTMLSLITLPIITFLFQTF